MSHERLSLLWEQYHSKWISFSKIFNKNQITIFQDEISIKPEPASRKLKLLIKKALTESLNVCGEPTTIRQSGRSKE